MQEKGLEAQTRALEEFCKQRGITDYVLFCDEGVSGSKASRPQLDSMMNRIRAGEFETLAVYSFSRFARSTKHLLNALEEFEQLGVQFVSISESLDTGSPIGRALFTIISAISQLERELISERVKNGLKNAVAKGVRLGRKKTRNSELIRELHSKAYSQRKIAKLVGCSLTTVNREIKLFQKPSSTKAGTYT